MFFVCIREFPSFRVCKILGQELNGFVIVGEVGKLKKADSKVFFMCVMNLMLKKRILKNLMRIPIV